MTSFLFVMLLGTAQAGERRHCDEAKIVDTLDAWSSYLNKHPRGRCSVIASSRIKSLQTDQDACDVARKDGSLEAWHTYLTTYPTGQCGLEGTTQLAVRQANGETMSTPTKLAPLREISPITITISDLKTSGDEESVAVVLEENKLRTVSCFLKESKAPRAVHISLKVSKEGNVMSAEGADALADCAATSFLPSEEGAKALFPSFTDDFSVEFEAAFAFERR